MVAVNLFPAISIGSRSRPRVPGRAGDTRPGQGEGGNPGFEKEQVGAERVFDIIADPRFFARVREVGGTTW